MKILRVVSDSRATYAYVDDSGVVRRAEGSIFDGGKPGDPVGTLDSLELLAPCEPTKIFCVGQNYRSALQARNRTLPERPAVFIKTPNSVVGPNQPILRPSGVEEFVYEGELAVVIGREARRVSVDEALDYVLGYTCGNDVTVRDWREFERHWVRCKSSDSFCPIGPWIETDIDPTQLRLQVRVNGDLQQDGCTDDLLFDIPTIISYLSQTITLVPGDVILTGTPLGAQPVVDGDVISITLEGIGTLSNPVLQEA
jgi:2-keto-4-pentenoate hydratase/2-oxohepta-3-ene-1,7-dioic acid hydratase in catechol pathway